MNKKELVDRVLAGEAVERPPLSLWYHFGVQHGNGEAFARITLDYFNHYDFDFLKVMNDYFYPVPDGCDALRTKADLRQIKPVDPRKTQWVEQLKALEIIAGEIGDKAYFIDTVFDPWQSLHRNLAAENMQHLMMNEPQALMEALEVVADNLIAYSEAAIEAGAAGIFMSIPAGKELVTREEFLTFVKPYAEKVLKGIQGKGAMTTLHVHGEELYFDDAMDLPAPIINWWDRGPQGPSMQEVLRRFSGCVMGGIDQTIVARRTRAFIKSHVREGIELGGNRRFLLANGCSIDTWVYPGTVEAIVAAARSQ
ncbi:MAG: uroporphyrinogen decarboxylase family protein [Desulfobacteraceae bacterium]